jgi:rod shape-determining protein MreC
MVRLKDEKFNLTRRGAAPSPGPRVRLLLPLLLFVAVSLMLLSRLNHSALANIRWRVAEWMSPVLQAAMVPLAPLKTMGRQIATQVDMAEEVNRLRLDNQKLSNWEWRARELERKLADLEGLSKVVDEPKIEFITSRVIADSSGAFVRSVVINAGREKKVRPGYPVINGDGLVGRVVETGKNSARVLLPTDLNSRIPVAVGGKSVRAILAGDNGSEPRLIYLPPGTAVAIGDEVATSGVGGLFPRGLRIGTVAGDLSNPRVKLRADLDQLEYLSVLFFDNPALELIGEAAPTKPQPNVQGAAAIAPARDKR